jgi:hypothetical protein
LGIDDAQNGILLTKTLHAMLSDGAVASLKVRSFGSSYLGSFKMQPSSLF